MFLKLFLFFLLLFVFVLNIFHEEDNKNKTIINLVAMQCISWRISKNTSHVFYKVEFNRTIKTTIFLL